MAVEARNTLERHASCLVDYVGKLEAITADQERALGDSIQRQRDSEAELARFRQEVEGFAAEAERERNKMEEHRANVERAARERDEQAERLKVCRDVFFLFPDICNAGEDVVKQLNWMNDAQADLNAAEPRLQEAIGAWEQARQRLDASTQQASNAQQQLAEAQNAVARTESAIASTKLVASQVREQIQPFNTLIAEFSTSLDEAADLNLDEARWRTLRRVSSETSALAASLPEFVRATQSALPEEAQRSCSL
ncbi:hypothetical protein ACSV9I_07045 [Rhizobium sp. G187]|uniref:hypothetical protein n=1 Tax=Rhizobium sp. G187 TaxID=3451352 RepID=UPI003EE55EC6